MTAAGIPKRVRRATGRVSSALKQLHLAYQAHPDTPSVREYVCSRIGPMLCLIVCMTILFCHTKLAEYAFLATRPDLRVNEEAHGADLLDDHGRHYEHKFCGIWRNSESEAGFRLVMPVDKKRLVTLAQRRRAFIEVIREKVGNGGALFLEIFKFGGPRLHLYTINGAFLEEFVRRYPFVDKDKGLTFVCKRCPKCGSFHKFASLQKAGEAFVAARGKLPAAVWKALFGRIATSC